MDKRSIRIEGDIAFIPLTQGLEAMADAADATLLERHNWNASRMRGEHVYATAADFRGGKWTTLRMHRLLLDASPETDVDHISMNTLDNRRANLRVCTRSLNLANKKVRRDSASGLKGVFRHQSGRFRAKIKVDGRQIHLGYFTTMEEAKNAYNEAARLHFGEFFRP